MKHVGIDIKFFNLDTFNKQIDKFINLDSGMVDLNYKVACLVFCHIWRSITMHMQFSETQENLCLYAGLRVD